MLENMVDPLEVFRKRFNRTLVAISLAAGFILNSQTALADPYSVELVNNKEYRCKIQERHFMTIIKENGIFAIRPHPGDDVNGWGSTLYFQPFLPGANLSYTTINSINADSNGIHADVNGKVSRGSLSNYGDWNCILNFNYNSSSKSISGEGDYSITLSGNLSSSTGDLNLYKLASNYLDNVPLLGNGIGDTGDMSRAIVNPDTPSFTWLPPLQPAYFPPEITDNISINCIGNYNNVDTAAQGYSPIAAAHKPSIKVDLHSHRQGEKMIFGAIYDTTKAQDFWEDNVGITPLILKSSTQTSFDFDVGFYSISPEDNAARNWRMYE